MLNVCITKSGEWGLEARNNMQKIAGPILRTYHIFMRILSILFSVISVVAVIAIVSPSPAEALTTSVKCVSAATTYQSCVKTKYGNCTGKTGTALLTCMQTAAKTGTGCNPQSLVPCLSSSCQAAVTSLQSCVQKLKTACTGKKGSALQTCLKSTRVSGCDPSVAQKCAASIKSTASSARSYFSISSTWSYKTTSSRSYRSR